MPYIQGKTRIQKYGLLAAKQILNEKDFFDDWRPDNFGGFSPKLALCIDKLVQNGFVNSSDIMTTYGKKMPCYELSDKGKKNLSDFMKGNLKTIERIREIIGYYHQQKLSKLLENIYVLYPDLTIESKIKAEVSKANTKNNSYLSPEYEIAIDNNESIEIDSTVPANEHVFNDEYFREKLAKSIGLDKIPKLDPKSFDRLSGIISKKIETEEFDSIELVKAVRGC